MTITVASRPTTTGEMIDTVVLDGGLFLRPPPVVDQARRLAREGVDVVVTLPLELLDDRHLTGVTRMLLEASLESRLRHDLHAAGYRNITRKGVPGALVLDARA